ncbi:MAG: hypothetical protein HC927_14165, partial [Deltaproteobacteria bacterium]|nr:hypothetical protein [Deltaproteobacteria bacterium]
DFTVVAEPLMLRAAVSAQASRPTREQVVIELRPRLVGHAFPTGDLYRRLIVRVASEDGAWSEQRSLARHFAPRRVAGQVILSERSDDRVGVGAGSRIVEFEVPAELRERALVWSLTYERVLKGGGTQAQVWDRSTVLEGRLEPRSTSEQSERASTTTE